MLDILDTSGVLHACTAQLHSACWCQLAAPTDLFVVLFSSSLVAGRFVSFSNSARSASRLLEAVSSKFFSFLYDQQCMPRDFLVNNERWARVPCRQMQMWCLLERVNLPTG